MDTRCNTPINANKEGSYRYHLQSPPLNLKKGLNQKMQQNEMSADG